MEIIHYDSSFLSDYIDSAMEKYTNTFIPEFFEQRFVRGLDLANL